LERDASTSIWVRLAGGAALSLLKLIMSFADISNRMFHDFDLNLPVLINLPGEERKRIL
jgi:hypothetical protein